MRGAAAPGGVLRGAAAPAPVFEKDWHDWIVKRQGQLPAFRRYVRENPERAALRRRNSQYFGQVRSIAFLGREWFAYGNAALLDLPVLVPLKGHRTAKPGTFEWDSLVDSAARIGPGGAGVSTFMSPLEKACGNAVFRAGGGLVVLCPDGFHPRWHPPREKERICASGHMLFLSLHEADGRKPSNKTLYDRCHEMIDLVVDGLTPSARSSLAVRLHRERGWIEFAQYKARPLFHAPTGGRTTGLDRLHVENASQRGAFC